MLLQVVNIRDRNLAYSVLFSVDKMQIGIINWAKLYSSV